MGSGQPAFNELLTNGLFGRLQQSHLGAALVWPDPGLVFIFTVMTCAGTRTGQLFRSEDQTAVCGVLGARGTIQRGRGAANTLG
jgi:hypothetical protein